MTSQNVPTTYGLQQPSFLVLSFSLFISYIVGTIIYRLYFHPLAKFPGPFWAKISTIPSWWHTRGQNRHLWLLSLQEKYGPEYRYRPDAVCLNTPSAYRTIHSPQGNMRKSDAYKVWPRTVDFVNTWNTTSIDVHARKRRVLNYAFSETALRSSEPFIQSNVDRWLELLGQRRQMGGEGKWTDSIDMSDQVTYLVFDILGDLAFGKSFDMKEPGNKSRSVIEQMIVFTEFSHSMAFSPWASAWIWLKPRGLDTFLALATPSGIKAWDAFVSNCQTNRAKKQRDLELSPNSEVRKDFYHWLWNAQDPETGEGYTLPELNAECELLTIAGSDTTATVISALVFYLSRNPHVQARLAEEISSTFASYEDIKAGPQLMSCNYLTAFIHEGLRMAPPVPAEPSRQVLPGGTTIEGHYFPEKTFVSTAFWAMQYNPTYFPEPLKFRPERWISSEAGSSEESVGLAKSAFCAFSTGPRGCVGKNMAWLEMRIVVAKLIWRFEVARVKGEDLGAGMKKGSVWRREEEQYQTYDVFVSDREGPLVKLKERFH